jgi:trk system potassium uptake protein TrkH
MGSQKVLMRHAVISLAIGWVLTGLLSSIPFFFHGMSPVDAFFESVSGWSGTGLTMIPDPAQITITINFWRAYTQWLGGFGIVLMALLFYDKPQTAQHLFEAEGRSEEFFLSLSKITKTILKIYLAYTAFGIIAFLFSGMDPFNAVFYTFTSLATGGFASDAVGIAPFGMGAMVICIVLMLFGGISFEAHYMLLRGKFKKFFSNQELRLLFITITIAFILVSASLYILKDHWFFDGFFYIVSAITGTGAGTLIAVSQFQGLAIFTLILMMIFGASYGSTTGAIKLWRTIIIFKVIRREIHRVFVPSKKVIPIKIGDRIVSDDAAMKALSFILLYLFLLIAGSVIFMLAGYSMSESVFTVASAQGNVGLATVSGQEWYGMDASLKLLLSIHMLAGRMEIIPLLVLLKSFGFGRKIGHASDKCYVDTHKKVVKCIS